MRYARRIGRHVLSDYRAIITRIIRLKIGVITFSTEVLFMRPGCGAPPRYKECLKKYAFSDFCNAALRTYRYESGAADAYYDLNSSIVKAQAEIHGNY